MDVRSLKSPELDEAITRAFLTNTALTAMERSRLQKSLDEMCKEEAAAINKIAASGNLELMLALEYQLQLDDLTNYAKTDQEIKNIRLGLTDFMAGLTNYERLVERPEEYREQADGYPSRNRDKQLDVPLDGLRNAINSQLTRIQQRQSLMVSDAAKALHKARKNLLTSIRKQYALLQRKVLHGES